MTIARTVAETIAGEATSGTSQERWNDMLNIASVMVNRAAMLGVSLDDVVSAPGQFNAYNAKMPPGTQSLVDMAEAALEQVQTQGPVNDATFYATPAAVNKLPSGLVTETETAGHIFKSDPAMRSITTAQGNIRPDPNALPSTANMDPLQKAINAPYENNGLLNGVTSLTSVPATAVPSQSVPAGQIDPAFSPNGLLSGNFPTSSFTPSASAPMGVLATGDFGVNTLGPSFNSFAPMANAGVPGGQMASVNERMGLADPGFDANRFAGPVPSTFDTARFGTPDAVSQVMQTPSAILDAPEAHPNINNFGPLAGAQPVQSPMAVQGVLGAMNQPNLAASAQVPMAASLFSPAAQTPNLDVSATGVLGANPAMSASTTANPLSNVPATADLGTNPALSAQAAAVPGSSQFGDINSPEMQAMKASAAQQLAAMNQNPATNNSFADLAAAGPVSAPLSATPTGILGQPTALTANATVANPSGILSGYQEPAKVTPAEQAINGILSQPNSLLSSQPLDTATPNLTSSVPTSSLYTSPVTPDYQQYQSFVPADVQTAAPATEDIGVSTPGYKNLVAQSFSAPVDVAQDPAVAAPSLQTISVPDQPTVATPTDTNNVTVQGPATTTATTQQQPSLSGSFPAAPAKQGILGGLVNKGTLTGGILGALAAGPVGGVLGGLLGNAINKNGGLTGLLGGQMPSINNIGGGLQNVASVYGGAAPGTQANTNNGGTVTSAPGGWTHYTSPDGVTTSFGPNQVTASYFGGPPTGSPDVDVSGYSPGLF